MHSINTFNNGHSTLYVVQYIQSVMECDPYFEPIRSFGFGVEEHGYLRDTSRGILLIVCELGWHLHFSSLRFSSKSISLCQNEGKVTT